MSLHNYLQDENTLAYFILLKHLRCPLLASQKAIKESPFFQC